MALNETTHAGGYILSEANGTASRENGKLNTGQDLQAGTVLGQLKTAAGEKVSGTGNGTIGSVTVGPEAQVGVYVLRCVAESADAGTFTVTAPDGSTLPSLTVAAAYVSSHFGVTIADGSSDWKIGDVIHVTVAGGDYEQLDPTATDGTEHASAILYAGVDATAADKACVVSARDTDCNANEIIWPSGITAAQKARATQQLLRRNIRLR
jgi:hypothetical protein